ncbi:hypothetical protein C8Q77DRAFT_684797 [Trametes polyzona]|nr:hypothetical protein C8Q77DRAFT_684797 [Trametes polyzona]
MHTAPSEHSSYDTASKLQLLPTAPVDCTNVPAFFPQVPPRPHDCSSPLWQFCQPIPPKVPQPFLPLAMVELFW